MTQAHFITRLGWMTLPLLFVICTTNFIIDAEATHHLPDESSIFPRTTAQSALAKLHYLSIEKPDVEYFGSSRVEVGLPARPELVGGTRVYNAGLSGALLGQWAPFARHVLALTNPRKVVIGVTYSEFTTTPGDTDSDYMTLLSTNYNAYLFKRIPFDLGRALSIESTRASVKSIAALLRGGTYDEAGGVLSRLGQTTSVWMNQVMTGDRAVDIFRKRIIAGYEKSPRNGSSKAYRKDMRDSWVIFDDLIHDLCQGGVVVRIFIHPMHALRTEAIRLNGQWQEFESWKTDLAIFADRYKSQSCDLRALDFSWYNGITTETISGWSPQTPMIYYWEASHYKDNVGALILHRLFQESPGDTHDGFGYELRGGTVTHVLDTIRQEQIHYDDARR